MTTQITLRREVVEQLVEALDAMKISPNIGPIGWKAISALAAGRAALTEQVHPAQGERQQVIDGLLLALDADFSREDMDLGLVKRAIKLLQSNAEPAHELTLENAPLGTKAPAYTGGCWVRVERGWLWSTGATFPRPGGDWDGRLIAPEVQPSDICSALEIAAELGKEDRAKQVQPAQGELVEFLQFLSDVLTAAGLVEHGKQSKSLSKRIAIDAMKFINMATILKSKPEPEEREKPMQGLAAYLRCEAGGVFVGHPAHETLMQWASEVDAALLQSNAERVPPIEKTQFSDEELYGTELCDCGQHYHKPHRCSYQ